MEGDSLSQGQSYITEEKERGFATFFAVNLKAIGGRLAEFGKPYFHFDLHSGSGWNEQVGVPGSPILFAEEAKKAGVDYRMFAIDSDHAAACQLAKKTAPDPNTFVFHGDNAELVAMIPELITRHNERPQYALGSILLDPNNCKHESIPWKALSHLADICPRLDIAFNYPGNAMKRERRSAEVQERNSRHFVDIEEIPGRFNKKHVLIREPLGDWQFCLIVMRNYQMKPHTKIELHAWDSEEGKRFRRIVRYSKEELATIGQPKLPWPPT